MLIDIELLNEFISEYNYILLYIVINIQTYNLHSSYD